MLLVLSLSGVTKYMAKVGPDTYIVYKHLHLSIYRNVLHIPYSRGLFAL